MSTMSQWIGKGKRAGSVSCKTLNASRRALADALCPPPVSDIRIWMVATSSSWAADREVIGLTTRRRAAPWRWTTGDDWKANADAKDKSQMEDTDFTTRIVDRLLKDVNSAIPTILRGV
mmetsp:Transcript_20857/g.45203  ORF Transcript_20857/g.45203 Transcript_20857/m.45203 type:complete len:119 (-) Transcript_20857:114-470(-)